MADFKKDFQRLVFWHPESEVVIFVEDMPEELMPIPDTFYENLPSELAEAWKDAWKWDALNRVIREIYGPAIAREASLSSTLWDIIESGQRDIKDADETITFRKVKRK